MKTHHTFLPRPPMGWNSWDCYGASVTEAEVRANADYMARHLKSFGWEYVVVDIQWYEATANSSFYHKYAPLEMDGFSRLVPAVNRFPSASGGAGFKPLADYVHGLALKFGIHIMRGIPRQAAHADTPIKGSSSGARAVAHPNAICPWNTDMYGVDPAADGAQAYYDSLFELYASWGVDFVKVDDIAASRLYGSHLAEIALIRRAIDRSGRAIALSLSPGPAPLEYAAHFIDNANLWRITDDYWDKWELLADMFDRCEKWRYAVGPGHWPDCDMLPLGHIGIRSVDGGAKDRLTRFTPEEQKTMMSLWCLFRSPLFFGGELNDNDGATLDLITNPEVIAVNQTGSAPRLVSRAGTSVAWTSTLESGETVLGLFNLADRPAEIRVDLASLDLATEVSVRDLWKREDAEPAHGSLARTVAPHGSTLLRLAAVRGQGDFSR